MMESPLRWAMRHLRETSVAIAYLALLATLFFARPDFYSTGQFWKTIVYSAPTLVAAVGMTLVIIARQIDISIGWQVSVAAVTSGLLAQRGVSLPLVIAAGIAVGASFGAVNGALVAALKLPSIVVTLATLVILRESLGWIRGGEQVRNLSEQLEWFRAGQYTGEWLIVGVAIVVWLAGFVAMRYLPAGRAVYATGADEEAARLAGIRPQRVTFHVFVLMGALAGLAALLKAVQEATIEPVLGRDFEFQVIAAVVVGGIAISGGRGNLVGALLGVLLLGAVSSAFLFLGIDVAWEKALEGAIILLAVAIDALDRRQS
jgi:rhamnose transport system permease protein